jgi:hypothetical protein
MLSPEVVQRELYAELGALAADWATEARRHMGMVRRELERGAAQIRLVRVMYWEGSLSPLAALDWLNDGRAMLATVSGWDAFE